MKTAARYSLGILAWALPTAAAAAPVTIEDASWLAGRWIGEGLGGTVEETWAPAAGDQMVGHFRLVKNGKPGFYEFMLLDVQPTGLRMRVKHFNPDFTGWEEKDGWHSFEPAGVEPNALKFDGMTIRRDGDTITFIVVIKKDGKVEDFKLRMHRAPL